MVRVAWLRARNSGEHGPHRRAIAESQDAKPWKRAGLPRWSLSRSTALHPRSPIPRPNMRVTHVLAVVRWPCELHPAILVAPFRPQGEA